MAQKFIVKIMIIISMLIGLGGSAEAVSYPVPPDHQRLFGKLQLAQVNHQTVTAIMKHYDIGYRELKIANPQVDLNNLLPQQRLLIPTLKLLPDAPQKGIIVNVASMRLYYFPRDKNYFETYPAGIGKRQQKTPLAKTSIVAKAKDPQWRPTEQVRQNFLKENGYPLPPVVMPGQDNPLGRYKLRLNIQAYLIHGTNEPSKIGTRTSAGCVHLFNKDVGKLYHQVTLHTPVNIIYQPYMASWEGDTLYFEAYKPIEDSYETPNYKQIVKRTIDEKHAPTDIDWDEINRMAQQGLGIPEPVGYVNREQS